MRAWLRRTVELQRELASIADVDPRWWLLAAGVALAETRQVPEVYLACDAEPDGDTFMGYRSPRPHDVIADAIARARAARTALRELDGTLPDQPLAVTIEDVRGAGTRPSDLAVAAFAIGADCLVAHLDDPTLPEQLAAVLRGDVPRRWHGATPFVCVSIGDEPIETARHGHRRAWTDRGGPWLGLGRTEELAFISTCHLVIDGHGHALLTARIAELTSASTNERAATDGVTSGNATASGHAMASGHTATTVHAPTIGHAATDSTTNGRAPTSGHAASHSHAPMFGPRASTHAHPLAPPLSSVPGSVPLAVIWRELPQPTPRVLPLAYELGCILHRRVGRADARFSPTIQIPVARGPKDDPLRLRRRVVSATTSVRFDRGLPEPFAAFEARTRGVISREAADAGLVSRLLAAARAVPVPLAWKRRSIGAKRPRWLETFADVIGGRALLSRIAIDAPLPPLCAVSSPSRLASEADPLGGCVITIVDDGSRAAITVCGSGFAGTPAAVSAFLDELLSQRIYSDLPRAGRQVGSVT